MTNTPIQKTNNAAVVARFGRSTLMSYAWLRFNKGVFKTFSEALRAAWAFFADLAAMELTTERDARREAAASARWAYNASRRNGPRNFGRGSRGYNVAVASR